MAWNNFKYKHITQSGRSMVEILGVLVVAGILSIGAVAGYRYGMNKYRANETINELQIRAMGLMQQINRGEIVELNMEMGNTTKLGYPVDAWIGERDTHYFYIALENVPPAICKQILKENWTTPTSIYVGNNTYYGDNENICGNDTYAPPMDFEFFRDFAEGSEYYEGTATYSASIPYVSLVQHSCSDSDNPLGDLNGNCYACDTTDRVEVGRNGQCSEICPGRQLTGYGYCVPACSADKPLINSYGSCYACDTTSNIYIGQNEQCSEVCSNRVKSPDGEYCALPCSADKPLIDSYGSCYACDYKYNIYVGQDGQCSEVCSNRVKSPDGYYCVLACSADKPLVNTSGHCYACNSTPSVHVGQNGQCSEICPDRIKDANGYCVLNCGAGAYADKPLRDGNGNCHACNDTTNIYVGTNGKCNEICANRQLSTPGYCSLSQTCDETKPLQDNYGKCYACDATDPVYVTPRGKCEAVCPNRVMTSGGYCALPCSADKPLMSTNGKCYACNDTSRITVGTNGQCSEICPGRQLTGYGYCVPACSADKPLLAAWGDCYACDTTSNIYIRQNGQCSEVCSNRVKSPNGYYCVLACSADKPLMDNNGNCYACDTTEKIWLNSNQQCSEICSNRQMHNGYCIHPCGVGIYKTRPLMHPEGVCYACDTRDGVYVGDGECEEVCANRTKRSDGVCYLDEEEIAE